MIVKILSSSGGFAGVGYNEDKVEKGTAQLLAAENFGLLQSGRTGDADYKGYFHLWSKAEGADSRVKQPQFHAVISCEGREKTGAELKEIATQYLEKMGYKANPYLIYFHTDTANNHVHLVSSRINREGKKIGASFERTRSQKAIKEILLQDVQQEIKAHLDKAMSYSFSTPAQFKLLLEQQGIKVNEQGSKYDLLKYGSIQSAIDKDALSRKIASYEAPEGRIRQLRALFSKYKPGLSTTEFKDFLQAKFGIELVLHQVKGKEAPYGYSVIDHAQKQVLKGSQVMKLNDLISVVSREDKQASARAIIGTLASNKDLTFTAFSAQLKKAGFTLNREGEVKIKGDSESSFRVDAERMKQLHYHERLQLARSFAITTAAEGQLLTKAFYLKPGNLPINSPVDFAKKAAAADRLNSMLGNGKLLREILESNKWAVAQLEGEHYLIDKREKAVHKISELTEQRLEHGSVDVLSLDSTAGIGRQMETTSGTFGEMFSILMYVMEANSSQQPQEERKVKRRIKRQ